MNKSQGLIKNTLILGFGKLVAQVSSFALLPVYTLFLSPGELGFVDLIISYMGLIAPLLIIQLDRGAFRYLIEARTGKKNGSKTVISSALSIVIPVLALALFIYGVLAWSLGIPHAVLIAVSGVAIVFSTLALQFARGLGRNDLFAQGSIALGVVNLVVTAVLLVWFSLGIEGVLYGFAASHIATALFVHIRLRLSSYISLKRPYIDRVMQKELIAFSWPLVPSAASWWFIRTFDRTLITVIAGVAANGAYAVANKYSMIFTALYAIFDMSWTESASEHINSKDRDKFFSGVYNTSFKFFTALAIGLIAITPFIFDVFIGSNFSEAKYYIPILIAGGFLNAIVAQYSVVYIAKKMTKEVLVTSISTAVISVILNVIFINAIGAMGAALALVLSFLVMAIWRHFDIKKYVTITFERLLFTKIIMLFAIVISLYYIDDLYINTICLILTTIIAYLLSRSVIAASLGSVIGKLRSIAKR